jgi:hypothetical protein
MLERSNGFVNFAANEVKVIIFSHLTREEMRKESCFSHGDLPVDNQQVLFFQIANPMQAIEIFQFVVQRYKISEDLLLIMNCHGLVSKQGQLEINFKDDNHIMLAKDFFIFLTNIMGSINPKARLHVKLGACFAGHGNHFKRIESNLVQFLPEKSTLFTYCSPNSPILTFIFIKSIYEGLEILRYSNFAFRNPAEFFLKYFHLFLHNSVGFSVNSNVLDGNKPIFYSKPISSYKDKKTLNIWLLNIQVDFVGFCLQNNIPLSKESKTVRNLSEAELELIRFFILENAISAKRFSVIKSIMLSSEMTSYIKNWNKFKPHFQLINTPFDLLKKLLCEYMELFDYKDKKVKVLKFVVFLIENKFFNLEEILLAGSENITFYRYLIEMNIIEINFDFISKFAHSKVLMNALIALGQARGVDPILTLFRNHRIYNYFSPLDLTYIVSRLNIESALTLLTESKVLSKMQWNEVEWNGFIEQAIAFCDFNHVIVLLNSPLLKRQREQSYTTIVSHIERFLELNDRDKVFDMLTLPRFKNFKKIPLICDYINNRVCYRLGFLMAEEVFKIVSSLNSININSNAVKQHRALIQEIILALIAQQNVKQAFFILLNEEVFKLLLQYDINYLIVIVDSLPQSMQSDFVEKLVDYHMQDINMKNFEILRKRYIQGNELSKNAFTSGRHNYRQDSHSIVEEEGNYPSVIESFVDRISEGQTQGYSFTL